jgi:hypothetical protein
MGTECSLSRSQDPSTDPEMNPDHNIPPCICKIYFRKIYLLLGLLSCLFPSGFLTKYLYTCINFADNI